MADNGSGERPRSSLRPNLIASLLNPPLADESKVLEALVHGLSTGETTPDLFVRLNQLAEKEERTANLSFSYERLARDARIKMLPKPKQAEFFVAAASFFGDVFGDADAAIGYAERAHTLAPDDPRVFDVLETLLAGSQEGEKLATLYADTATRTKETGEKLRLLRAAIELFETYGNAEEKIASLYRQIAETDPTDAQAAQALEKLYVASRRFKELSEILEKSLQRDPKPNPAVEEEVRLRLIGLYRGELRDPARAAPHVEALLSHEPIGQAALQAAEALVDHRPIAAKIAPLLSSAYRRLGRLEDEATTLALELRFARPPRLLEVHLRLATLRMDVLGDPAGALELLEPLVARDPSDDELRRRYIEVSTTFHREAEAAKLLGRALPTVKEPSVRARLALEVAGLHEKQGDAKRARALLEPLLDDAPDDIQRLVVARRLSALYDDGSAPKALANALSVVIRLDPELPGRVGAAKRLLEICEGSSPDPKLAIVAWRALIGSPRTEEALDRLEALTTSVGDEAGLVEVYRERASREKDPEKARKLAFRAAEMTAQRATDRAVAVRAFRDFLKAHGPSREALARLVTLLEQQRDFRGVESALVELSALVPENERAPLFGRLARVRYAELSDPDGALAAARSALALDPKDPHARRIGERLLSDAEFRTAAAQLLEPAYRAEENHAGLLKVVEARAEAERDPKARLGLLAEAFSMAEGPACDFKRALALAGQALSLAVSGKRPETLAWLERFKAVAAKGGDNAKRAEILSGITGSVETLDATTAEVARETAEAFVAAGEPARAVETYRRLLSHEPSSAELLRRIDELLAEQGNPKERLALYEDALARAPDAARRRDLLRAKARVERRDLDDVGASIRTLGILVAENPEDIAAHEALVDALTQIGDSRALSEELERAIRLSQGPRRAALRLRLARELTKLGDTARALAIHRELAAASELPSEDFAAFEELARQAGDGTLVLEVLERRVENAPDEREQAACLERLGDFRLSKLADDVAAADAYLRGARLARELPGEEARAVRLYERVLDATVDDVEAARYLVDAYVGEGAFDRVPAVFSVLLRTDRGAAEEHLASLEARVLAAHAEKEFVAMIDEAVALPRTDERSVRALLGAKARALAASGASGKDVRAILRGLVETYGDSADVATFAEYLRGAESDPDSFEDRRFLFSYRVEQGSDPIATLLAWAQAEETAMGDPSRARALYERALDLSPHEARAREAVVRLSLAEGDAERLVSTLRSVRERLTGDDAADVDVSLSSVLASLGRVDEALTVVEGVLDRPESIRTLLAALAVPEGRERASAMLGKVALEKEGAEGETLLGTLLAETRGIDALAHVRVSWYERLVERLSDPKKALAVAIEAAEELPAEVSLWERAERLARREDDPRAVAEAYKRTLSRPLDETLGEAVGRRYVEFHEEWFDEPEQVLWLLERVLALSPRARWALDRIKLAYNADGRWPELFSLYDRAISLAEADSERAELLDEAAIAAKDLASDSDRAISYLERLLELRPDARVEAMIERLYERTGRARELLALLERRVPTASAADVGRLELRMARLHADLGDAARAFGLAEKCLARDPNDDAVYALLERVVRLPLRPSAPPAKKGKKKAPAKSVHEEAVRILEERSRETADDRGLARALEAALGLAKTEKDRTRRLEELVDLYADRIGDDERAFEHLSSLVTQHPQGRPARERLAALAAKMGQGDRRAALLEKIAEERTERATKIELLREAATLLAELGRREEAAELHLRVLELSSGDDGVTLEVAYAVEALFAQMGRPGERADVLDRIVRVQKNVERRREALFLLAKLSSTDLGDPERAARAYRRRLEDAPEDVEALTGLVAALEVSSRWAELAPALALRAPLLPPAEKRGDLVRRAFVLRERLSDLAEAVTAWRAIQSEFGENDETFAALSSLLATTERYPELAALVEDAATRSPPGERRTELLRTLGDLCRDRTAEPLRALDAYAAAGDFERIVTVFEHVPSRDAIVPVASHLLELAVNAWRSARPEVAPLVEDAAHAAVETLVRRHQEDRAFGEVVAIELRASALPFAVARRRRFLRDAAFTTCDQLENPSGAIDLLARLFSDDRSDEVALASVTRYARLLDEAKRYGDLATLWAEQAEARAAAGDTASAAALYVRAADIWETRASDVPRAITTHRAGAALGGETSLEALARIHRGRNELRASAEALEWLVSGSTREELGTRSLALAETYLSLGRWDLARARLEAAAAVALDAGPVRQRLAHLYREHRDWSALADLLAFDADRVERDSERLSLLREAARIHREERGDPASAVPLLERAVELDPDLADQRLSLASALGAAGRYDEAAAVLRAQIERYGARRPKDRAIVHLNLARVSLAAGRRAEALTELDTATKINPAHPGILYELARLARAEGQLSRAERTYRALLLVHQKAEDGEELPGRARVYLELSEIAALSGEPDRAAELCESAFEAALDDPADALSLENALLASERYDLLARAVEARLAAAPTPAHAARALSDLVMLHASHLPGQENVTPRVTGDAQRIKRDLEAGNVADEGAWAAMSRVYEWLGAPEDLEQALAHHVKALLLEPKVKDVAPLLRLAEIRLASSAGVTEGVSLLERALDAGADPARVQSLLEGSSNLRDDALLRVLERIASAAGRERTLVDVLVLRAETAELPSPSLERGLELSRNFGDGAAEVALLEGALARETSRTPAEKAQIRDALARIRLREGDRASALRLWSEAAEVGPKERRREFSLQAGKLALEDAADLPKAAAIYGALAGEYPADREVWEPLLSIYRKLGDRPRLMALISATARVAPKLEDRSRLKVEEATLLLGDAEGEVQAIRLLEEILSEDPSQGGAAELLSGLLAKHGRKADLVRFHEGRVDAAKATGKPEVVEARLLSLGAALEEAKDLDSAREAYGVVLDWNASSRPALRALVRLADATSADPADVADTLERLLSLEEPAAVASLAAELVRLRTEQGDSLGVERALERACEANPLDVALREQLVARCLERVDWKQAAVVLRRAAAADPSDLSLLTRAVESYEHAGELPLAFEALGVALERSPSDPDLYLERARIATELGRHDEALADIERAHRESGGRSVDLSRALEAAIDRTEGEERARHTLRLAELLEELGETSEAREHLSRLVKSQPKHRDALRRLASLASAEARWDEAAATYRRLIPLEGGDALVATALNLADACEHSGHLADARGSLERVLDSVPSSAPLRARLRQLYGSTGAHRELAHLILEEARAEKDVHARTEGLIQAAELLLERDGDPPAAAAILDEAQRLSPENIRGAVLLARARAATGRSHEAMAALSHVVQAHRGRRSKDLSLVHHEISHIHLEAGDLSAALDALAKAFDLDMRNGDLAMQLGHLALDVSDTDMAQKAFRSVTMMRLRVPGTTEGTSAESRAVAYYHLSRIAQQQGDVRKARLMASKAVSENPAHSDAQALLRELRAS